MSFADVSNKYEKQLNSEKKKTLGIVYTPQNVVHFINSYLLEKWDKDTPPRVCDFSSGTGNFLVNMAQKISERYDIPLDEVYEKYIFANDLDKEALKIFHDQTGCQNITSINGLDYPVEQYDICVSNPPYVKIQNLDIETRHKIRQFSWCSSGNTDLYIAMCEKIIKSGIRFGIVCPNTWMKSKTGKNMKKDIFDNRLIETLIDFRNKKIFKAGTYTNILFGHGKSNQKLKFSTDMNTPFEEQEYSSLNESNFYFTKAEKDCVIENSKKQNLFLENVSMKVGLATLADKVYFIYPDRSDDEYHYIEDFKIERDICQICYKASKLEMYSGQKEGNHHFIIYPYDANQEAIGNEYFQEQYPHAYRYLESHKDKLLARDKGKFGQLVSEQKLEWYEYGRRQGMSLQNKKVLLSPIMTKKSSKIIENGLFISGYCLVPTEKSNLSIEQIYEICNSDDFKKWITINGDSKQGNYFSIKTATLKGYKYNI